VVSWSDVAVLHSLRSFHHGALRSSTPQRERIAGGFSSSVSHVYWHTCMYRLVHGQCRDALSNDGRPVAKLAYARSRPGNTGPFPNPVMRCQSPKLTWDLMKMYAWGNQDLHVHSYTAQKGDFPYERPSTSSLIRYYNRTRLSRDF
jgi:hypothetical protein